MKRLPLPKQLHRGGSRCGRSAGSEALGNELALLALDEVPTPLGEGAQGVRTQRPHTASLRQRI
jgi:hypothetical protein